MNYITQNKSPFRKRVRLKTFEAPYLKIYLQFNHIAHSPNGYVRGGLRQHLTCPEQRWSWKFGADVKVGHITEEVI